jgi:hypothetical protein
VEDQENKNEEVVEIVLQDKVEEVEEKAFDIEGLAPEEIQMAKDQGLYKEPEEVKEDDGEQQEQSETKTDSDTEPGEKEEKKEEEVVNPTFEDVEKKEELIEKFNPNEKALFWKWKGDKKKRQAAQKELEELKASSELSTLKDNVGNKKLKQISDILGGDADGITIEALQAIISGEGKKDDNAPLTRADLEEIERVRAEKATQQSEQEKRYADRVQTAEKIGQSKYDNFDDIAKLAQEVVSGDKTGTYQQILSDTFVDTEIDEDQVVERVVTIAQLSPKFKELVSKATPEDQEKVGRAIENSKKKKSSASLGGSGKRVVTSESDLTVDDIPSMSSTQWSKLKRSTKDRLLKASCS